MLSVETMPADASAEDADRLPMPSVEGMVAATLALMTAWAAPCPDARVDPATLRRLLAHKVVSNLYFLKEHPLAGAALRQVVAQVHACWTDVALAGAGAGKVPDPSASRTGGVSEGRGALLH